MAADSVATFLRSQNGGGGWQTVASIKAEVDRLSGCDLVRANELAERLHQLSQLLGDPLSHAFAEAGRARVLDNKGRHAEANELYERAAGAMQTAGLRIDAAIIRKQQLHALIQLGRYDAALRTAGAARRVLARADPVQLAQLEANIGNIYYRLDRYRKALSHYDRARDALLERGDDTMLAVIDFSRSSVFAEIDQPERALDLLQKAATQFDCAGRSLQAEQCRFHIAYLQFLRGNYNQSLASYHRVRDRVAELGSDELAGYCSLGIAQVLLTLNAFDDAAETAASALDIFEKLGMPFESARACLVSGLTAMGLRNYGQARGELIKARAAFGQCRNVIFTALADAYLAELAGKIRDFGEMSARARSSLRVFSRNRLPTRAAWSRLLMARASYELQDLARAAQLARKALATIEGVFAPGITYQCHHLLGLIHRARNRPKAALNDFRRAVEAVQQMREWIVADEFKASFLQDKTEIYEDAIAACLEDRGAAGVKEAFHLVESSKSRALADLLSRYSRHSAAGDGEKPGISGRRNQLLKLIEDLNWYASQTRLEEAKGKQRSDGTLERYRSAALRCERQVRQLFNRIESERGCEDIDQIRTVGVSDLRGALSPGEIAIEFFAVKGRISAFIASPDDVQVIPGFTSTSRVESLISALRFQLEKLTYEPGYVSAHSEQLRRTTDHHLRALYSELFAPLGESVSARRIIIVPHGVLHYLPFHALYDGEEYLIDRFEISYAPSASALTFCRARRARQVAGEPGGVEDPREMVAVGVPDEEAPHIEQEIQLVAALFPDSITLVGSEATSANVHRHAPAGRFLHLASHGYFRRDNPMFSFLKLADSRLHFYSLVDLRLRAEMVTLSACQTGVNALLPGDELHGLMRGFLYAGAPALTVSLWKVADRSTAELMTEMYTNIRAGQSKRAALRNAQLAVKRSYNHPYHWAPFVLMGSPD
jgi:tetratricopeptide (TPR) repeat protein